MLFNIILISTFFVLNKNKSNLFFLKLFYIYNLLIFFIFNFQNIKLYDDIFFYFFIILLIIFSNKNTIFLFFIFFYIKSENLLINLVCLEIINIIFFSQTKNDFEKNKNIIIYNYFLTTFFIIFSISYFYSYNGTLNKNMLFLLDEKNFINFLLFYIFIKMGGLIGFYLHNNFYMLLGYKDLFIYNLCNFYFYIYIFQIELFNFDKKEHTMLVLFLLFFNFIIIFLKKKEIKNNRSFLFYSSQILLSNIYIYLFL